MAKLLFYAHDPGGANTLFPLIEPLKKNGHDLFIYGANAALKILPDITCYQGDTDELIKKIMPDFVITGTSTDDLTEKKIKQSARKFGIKSLAILDAWINYNRFTKYSCTELNENGRYDETEYLPDYYIVMDDYAKQEAIKEKVPSEIIYPLGNPHFEFIKQQIEKLEVSDLRKKLLGNKTKVVVYASCADFVDYGKNTDKENVLDLLEVLPNNANFIVKPHPRDIKGFFDDVKGITIIDNIPSQEVIKASDLVVSSNSMLLIESLIMNQPCISYQKHQRDKNNFILTKIGALPFINDKIELKREVLKKLNQTESNVTVIT